VVGRLVSALEEEGILDNTIIIFVGDNGPYIKPNIPHMPEEFHQVPVSSAAPLRDGKGTIYEGGTRVPLIVFWPGKVPAGSVSHALHQSTDFFPTFADMLDWELPDNVRFDGISMKPVLEKNKSYRDDIFCHFPHKIPSTSLRVGDWKLIRWWYDHPDVSHRYELFNLAEDEGEANNLTQQESKRVKKLSKRMDVLLRESEAVIPVPNPNYKGEDQ
jgi:arylsulfatase A-like enzyme